MEKFTNFLNERFGLDDLVDIGIQFSIEDDKIYLNYNLLLPSSFYPLIDQMS